MNLHGPRGKGVRTKVSGDTRLPANWMDFLLDSTNKKVFCYILISKVAQFSWPPAKAVHVTSEQGDVHIVESIPMQNCNYGEADTMQDCGLRTACPEAGGVDYLRTYCHPRCCSYPCRHIP